MPTPDTVLDLLRPLDEKPRPLFAIAGPCVIEDPERGEDYTLRIAERLAEIFQSLGIPWIFKASFDKANRTSIESYRGPGLDAGLRILARIRSEIGVPTLTDVHGLEQVTPVAEAVDVLQIPAFLCRQTDLVVAAARAAKAVNIKKGQFLAPGDMANVLMKAQRAGGTDRVALTERGTSFGYGNLVVDMTTFPTLRALGAPAIFDATHSVQLPGGRGTTTGGRRDMIPTLTRAAVAAGADGVFMEAHPDPDQALSDGSNMLPLEAIRPLLATLQTLRASLTSDEG